MSHEDLITGLDILHAVQLDCGEAASATGRYGTDAKRYVRKAYWRLLTWERWPWALSPTPGIITTAAKQDVTVSSISSATPGVVTLSATIATSQAGKKFYLDGNQSVYRIAAHTAGTALLTLDAKYVETETAGAGVIFQDEYQMGANVLKIWDPLTARGTRYGEIKLMDKPRFEQLYGRGSWGIGFGPLEACCEVAPDAYEVANTSVMRKLRFAPWSEEALNLEFDYTTFHNLDFSGSGDADTPRIPRDHRSVLVDLAAFELFIGKDDTKADQAMAKAAMQVAEMRQQYIPSQDGRVYVQAHHSAALGLT